MAIFAGCPSCVLIPMAQFLNRIHHVVAWHSNKQVRWVHAERVVASVANPHAVRYRSDINLVRDAVRVERLSFASYLSVTFDCCTSPYEATT